MRTNLPVTGREYPLRADQSLISRTDEKGNINYVNKDFVAVSGFSEDELLGAPHNIVRHPDMPKEAFADMWRTLKAGRSWTGMVKNRRKNGDHYWVQANATPIWENGAVTGYTSVRTMPSRSQIDVAEAAYAKFRHGRARGLTIVRGAVVRAGWLGILTKLGRLGVAGKIRLALAILSVVIASLGITALYGMATINQSLHTVYQDRTVPMAQLDKIVRALNRNEIELLQVMAMQSPEGARSALQFVRENEANISKTWAEYRATYLTKEERELAERFERDYGAYIEGAQKQVASALAAGDFGEAKRLQREVMKPAFEPVRGDIDDLLRLQLEVANAEAQAAAQHYAWLRAAIVAAILLAVAFAALVGKYLAESIVTPLRAAVDIAKQIAACNLSADVQVKSRDETGELMHALRVMQLSLSNIVKRVRESAGIIASNSAEIAAGNLDLSSRTEQQAASLEETASSMEELTSTVKHNAERSEAAGELVREAQDAATVGGSAMTKVVATMGSITQRSRRITDIIGVIDGITFQTNLLALNAAVEAARAGEQGRGFAVVAGEVRSLAQRSAVAAKEIKELINDSVAQTELGANEVLHTQQTMQSVVSSVSKVAGLMVEITDASREQASGIEQVGLAVTQLDQVTQQNAALVEEAAAASENLQQKGADLLQEFEVFRVDPAQRKNLEREMT